MWFVVQYIDVAFITTTAEYPDGQTEHKLTESSHKNRREKFWLDLS